MSAASLAWAVSSVCSSLASDALGIRPRTLIVICALPAMASAVARDRSAADINPVSREGFWHPQRTATAR